MAYNNYQASLLLYFLALIANVVIITLLIIYHAGLLYLSVAIILFVVICLKIRKVILFPIEQVKMFLLALRSGDNMIRMPQTKDKCLQQLYENMNLIIARNHENEQFIETKKLYYDRILRIMTHEIRNTVTPIITLSEHYIENCEKQNFEDIKEGMEIINSQSKSIKRFLDSYRELTHIPPPRYEKIYIPELFNEMYKLFEKKQNCCKLEITCPQMYIYADAAQIRMILANLLKNAIDATEKMKDGHVALAATICENRAQIMVTDNGCGIPENRIEDIFLPFYTTKNDGNGIGLCISRQIMKLHNGDIIVKSNPMQRHTVFTIIFPPAI